MLLESWPRFVRGVSCGTAFPFDLCAKRSNVGSLRESDNDFKVAFATSVAKTYFSFDERGADPVSQTSASTLFAICLLRDVGGAAGTLDLFGLTFSFSTICFVSWASNASKA